MSYMLEVEFVESSSEGRLALYRHALLTEAQTCGTPVTLRVVGSGWDRAAENPTQLTDVATSIEFTIVKVSPSRLLLSVEEWPDEAPLGELMQFSIGDGGGELYLWTRALSFRRQMTKRQVVLDADG